MDKNPTPTVEELATLPSDALHSWALRARQRLAWTEWELGLCLLAVERTELHRQMECGTVGHYAEEHLDLDGQKASELLRTARVLEKLPRLDAAYRAGRLCWGKMREITRVVCAATEEQWLQFALANSTTIVQQQVRMSPREWRWRAQSNLATEDDLFSRLDDAGPGSDTSVAGSGGIPKGASRGASEGAESKVRGGAAAPWSGESAGGSSGVVGRQEVPLPGAGAGVSPDGDSAAITAGPGVPPRGSGAGGAGKAGATAGDPGLTSEEPRNPAKSPTGPLPLPDGPRFVRVTLDFTPDEYAVWEQVEQIVRSQLKKRARRVEVALAMADAARSSAIQRTKNRHQVILHVNAETGDGWYDTDRGLIPASPDKVAEALDDGKVVFANSGPVPEDTANAKPTKTVTVGVMAALYARAGGRCEVCQRRGLLHVHHRQPKCRGGTNELYNLELRCSACHTLTHEKDHRDNPEWRAARQRKSGRARTGRRPREASG